MSRKRRRRPAPQPKKEIIASVGATNEVAKDGYVNSLAYLGEASPLSQANDFERHSISNDFNLLTIMYRENWLAARIIDTPCEDMTRAWYSISSEIDQDRLDELQKLEARHSVKQEITNAIRWGRLYGGAAAVMVIKGQEDMLDEPLDYDMLQPGCFRGLIVIDRVRGIFPSLELEEDMDDVEFGYPKWYQVTLNEESGEIIRIHHSRLLLFRGRQLPIDEEVEADYWGASELEHVYEELQKRNSSSANIAQLIFQANVAALKISDYGEVMGMGTAAQREQVYRYVQEMNRLRTSFGITLMGNEDNYEQHPYSFAGVAEVYETFMMDMAGAAEIPATKLFGRAPQGMNATGESDMKNYYEVISQLQERILKPALEKLLPVMCMSLWGEVPEDMEIVFEPLGTTTPAERSEMMGQATSPIVEAFSAGLISQRTALLELREAGKPINAWTNITDEDIAKAEDEVDQGEMMQDPMGMMGGMPPGEAPEGQMPEEQPQPEVDMDKVHELKERIHSMREENELGDGGDIQVGLEYGDDPEVEQESDLERVRNLKERVKRLRENQPAVEPEEEIQPEVDMDKVRELKGRIGGIREKQSRQAKIDELRARIERIRKNAEVGAEDGGPGSGPRPGYRKKTALHHEGEQKPGLLARAKFMLNPTAGMRESKRPQRTPESVNRENKEREDWYNLSAKQRIEGNAAEERHIRKVKAQVAKAAMKGDIEKARNIVKANRHYWSNDPESAMKVQSETLKRQKAVKSGFLHDALSFLKGQLDGGPGSGNHGHAGRPGQRGGSAPKGSASAPIDNGPQTAYNGRATKGWKRLNAVMKVGGPRAARAYIKAYAAKHPEIAEESKKYMDVRRKVLNFTKEHPEAQNFNTYDAETGEVKNIDHGYCVTFHQNRKANDPLGGYSDRDYAMLCAIAMRELGAKGVNIGYYGNPEVSFECESEEAAKRFAVEHNQQSVYNASTGRTLVNKEWRKDLNPIRL